MILQKLCELYDVLSNDKSIEIAPFGYSSVECSYCIVLTRDGDISTILPLGHEKKKIEQKIVPEHKKRSSATAAYFLCDYPKNLLGYEYKTDKKTKKKGLKATSTQIQSSLKLHQEIIGNSSDEGLRAVLLFLKKQSESASPHPLAQEEHYKGKSMLFRLENEAMYIHEHEEAKRLWGEYCQKHTDSKQNPVYGQCLVTGEEDVPITLIHNSISIPIPGEKPIPCSLVSFKPEAFLSYGKKQSHNSPVSEAAAFKYITALKYLLDNPKMHTRLGETTVVFWATRSPDAQDVLAHFLSPQQVEKPDPLTTEMIRDIFARIKEGKSIQDITGDHSVSTYVLGLSPNAARASVRFWYETTFEQFMRCMVHHQEEIGLLDRSGTVKEVSFNQILHASVSRNVTEKWWEKVPTSFENALFTAIILGENYPISLYINMLQRIRTEAGNTEEKEKKSDDKNSIKSKDGINYVRVGFVKAVLCRNYGRKDVKMSLNLKSTDKAYNLGRLFAVLEKLQETANKNSTIRGRFFASASTNPKLVFPSLLNLAQHHIEKVDSEQNDLASKYDADISKLLWSLNNEFPAVLNLEEQGLFILGYYHQREYYYLKKEEREKLEKGD